jgi:integrase
VRLFLLFVSADARRPISQLQIEDLTFERVLGFLQHLETTRHNHVATRNQRLAGLRTFFEYVCRRLPEMLHVCERVAAIPMKRTPLPEARFLDREEIATLFARLPREGRHANRDHALLLMLYNTGARVQEIADLRLEHVSLTSPLHVRLHGKGDKWRTCPLWEETGRVLRRWLDERGVVDPHAPGVHVRDGPHVNALRHLQTRAAARRSSRIRRDVAHASDHAPRVSAHGRRTSPRSRRRAECDPRPARTRQPGDHESVRGNHGAHERGRDEVV